MTFWPKGMIGVVEIVDVHPGNIQEKGFFCMRSKPQSDGYRKKLSWLLERFKEGLKLKIIEDNGRPKGFIEYVPIEYGWRGVQGNDYMLIHCLWVVGKGKGKGYGARLLAACIEDAKKQNKSGVAMVTSSQTWLSDKPFFMKHGFESVDFAPPCFELVAIRFDGKPYPKLNHGWEERAQTYGNGITVLKSDQCPYIEDAVHTIVEVARERGIPSTVIDLDHAEKAQLAPTAYGVFQVIYNGNVLTYHPLTKRELNRLLDRHA